MLNARNFEIAKIAAKWGYEDALSGLLITKTGTVAADGHRLAYVSNPSNGDEEDDFSWDIFLGLPLPVQLGDYVIPQDNALKIQRDLPTAKGLHEFQKSVRVDVAYSNRNGVVKFDLLDEGFIVPKQEPPSNFPDWRSLLTHWDFHFGLAFPSSRFSGGPQASVTLNAKYLKELFALAEKYNDSKKIRLEIWGTHEPVHLFAVDPDNGQELRAIIMPIGE